MQLHYGAIFIASVLQFIFGAIWYMPIFGKIWGKIHGFDMVPKEEQAKMMKGMWKFLLLQFGVTVVTTLVFDLLMQGFPAEWNVYGLAFFFWIGFVVPTQVGAVVFGGTQPKWIIKKLLIMALGSLGCLLIAAAVLGF